MSPVSEQLCQFKFDIRSEITSTLSTNIVLEMKKQDNWLHKNGIGIKWRDEGSRVTKLLICNEFESLIL